MGICMYGFDGPEKDVCGDDTAPDSKYCEYHRREVKLMRSCGHRWNADLHPFLFEYELAELTDKMLEWHEKQFPCNRCAALLIASDLLVIQKRLSESDDAPF